MSMLWLHIRRVTGSVFAGDMRFVRLAMAVISAAMMVELIAPGEKLSTRGHELLAPLTDLGLAAACALHVGGMLRSVYKLRERPIVDLWANMLGVWIFEGVGLAVNLSLHGWNIREWTLLGWGFIVLGLVAAWGTVRSGNGAEGTLT